MVVEPTPPPGIDRDQNGVIILASSTVRFEDMPTITVDDHPFA